MDGKCNCSLTAQPPKKKHTHTHPLLEELESNITSLFSLPAVFAELMVVGHSVRLVFVSFETFDVSSAASQRGRSPLGVEMASDGQEQSAFKHLQN